MNIVNNYLSESEVKKVISRILDGDICLSERLDVTRLDYANDNKANLEDMSLRELRSESLAIKWKSDDCKVDLSFIEPLRNFDYIGKVLVLEMDCKVDKKYSAGSFHTVLLTNDSVKNLYIELIYNSLDNDRLIASVKSDYDNYYYYDIKDLDDCKEFIEDLKKKVLRGI